MFSDDHYQQFRDLRITQMAKHFEALIVDEANDHLAPEEVFLQAVQDALLTRQTNRINTLIRKADFPLPEASIEEIHYEANRNITPTRMRRYGLHAWEADSTNVLILSPTGGGKTYLACAIGMAACQREYTVKYWRMDELARHLAITRTDSHAHQAFIGQLVEYDLLILDDFLTVGIDHHTSDDLFAILTSRDGKASTIIAAQSGPGYWLEALPDKVTADSIVNRLAHRSRTIDLGTTDMREILATEQRSQPGYWQ